LTTIVVKVEAVDQKTTKVVRKF